MHWLDITLLIVLGIGALLGARSGLLWQVARIVTFAVAIYVCLYYHDYAASLIAPYLTEGTPATVSTVAGYVVSFLGVYLVLYGITLILEKMLKAAKLKTMDRLLGAGFGLLKAGLLAGAVLMGMAVFAAPQTDEMLADSRLAPVFLQVMRGVIVAVPRDYKDQFTAALDRIKQVGLDRAQELGGEATRHAVEEQLRVPGTTAKEGATAREGDTRRSR
jgi:membrane protein required for colicin V production